MNSKTFHIVSLGCAKNSVDSDSMKQLLVNAGYRSVDDVHQADILIVNTCGFISTAKQESYNALDDLAASKKSSQVLIAAGCLTQRYGTQVKERVTGVDAILGTRRWMDIVGVIEGLCAGHKKNSDLPETVTVAGDERGVPRVSVQGASAYLKIADGCRRPCAFCAIPLIKGIAVSRPIDSILAEARNLQAKGVREIVLIAQDTTDYGYDLGLKNGLAYLLKKITDAAPEVDWIRIMYAYPGYVTDGLIEVIANNKQVAHYLDMPLQHSHPAVLRRMRRPTNVDWVHKTIEKMRKNIPDLAIRTTFMVGYPGETEGEFHDLLDFVGEMRFDKIGVFKYSFEQGTAAESLGDPVSDEEKADRLKRLMETQQTISLERNREMIGRKLDVLIEGSGEDVSIGRSYRDAPEIDGLVLVKGKIPVGQLIPVLIKKASIYDLSGVRFS